MKYSNILFLGVLLFSLMSLASLIYSRGGGGCFLPGTPISTPNGTLDIDKISIHDTVLSFDELGNVHASKVSDVYEVERDYYYLIESQEGTTVKATAEHPFLIGINTFKEASLLNTGDQVFLLNGSTVSSEKIRNIQKINEKTKAYNLEVDSDHTFFASGFAVHNKGGCFDGSTIIDTPNGSKNISDLKIGDLVSTFDESGKIIQGKVTETYALVSENYYTLITNSGRSVNVTAEHPFLTKSGFTEVADLQAGDEIFVESNQKLSSEKITSKIFVNEPLKVYNLQIDNYHTYFANGFAVHNKGGGCFLDGTEIQTDMSGNSKTIESLSVGDYVISFDENGQIHKSKVVQKYEVVRDYYFIIENDLGSIVRVTAEHPFLTSNGYVEAQNLQIGSEVFSFDKNLASNEPLKVSKITKITKIDQPAHAYNLQVDHDHTFFANGYAVHNKGGSSGSSTPYYPIEYYDCSKYQSGSATCCERVGKVAIAYYTTPSNTQTYLPPNFVSNPSDLNCYCKSSIGDWQGSDSLATSYGCKCTNTLQTHPTNAPICFSVTNTVLDSIDFICGNVSCIFAILYIYYLLFYSKKKGNSQWSNTISVSKSQLDQKSKQVSALLSTWSKADPKWEQAQMTKTALATFTKLQECWSKRDYSEMEPLLMNSLYSQHVAQLKAMEARHEINKMDNLKILDSKIVLVKNYYNQDLDEFVIWIKATAKDTIIDDRNNRLVRGDSGNGIFEEFWTFQSQSLGTAKKWTWKLRQIDQPEEGMSILSKENYDQISTSTGLQNAYAKTGSKGKINLATTREQEIPSDTNVGDIKTKSNKVSRLLNFLYDNDKIWNEQKMIDNARAAFITINTAIEIGDFSNLSNLATSNMCLNLQKDFESLKSKGLHIEKRNLAVRNVEIVLVRNYYDNKKDEYTAWISGQSQSVTVNKSGQIVYGDNYVADFEEFWTFTRNVDKWQLSSILKGFGGKKMVDEENFDEGSSKDMMQWYYTRERV